eukprot:4596795-Prymnesium_polylepis.1
MRQSTWQMRQGKVTCHASHTSICETMGCSTALETAFRMTLPVHVLSLVRATSPVKKERARPGVSPSSENFPRAIGSGQRKVRRKATNGYTVKPSDLLGG